MGEVEEKNESESQAPDPTKKSVLFAVIMLIIGLFAPILISAFNTTTNPDVSIQGMFWMYRLTPSQWNLVRFAIIIDPSSWMVMFPFFILRMVPVSQMYRYYNGKTTRIRVFIASVIGDGLFLFMGLMMSYFSFVTYSDTFHIPLPFQIVFSFFVLVIFRVPKPKAPWAGKQSTKSWWAKEPDSQQEKVADDELW